jgi:hypothetical protein
MSERPEEAITTLQFIHTTDQTRTVPHAKMSVPRAAGEVIDYIHHLEKETERLKSYLDELYEHGQERTR